MAVIQTFGELEKVRDSRVKILANFDALNTELQEKVNIVDLENMDIGNNEIYIGTGEMPEKCKLQIDPTGENVELGDLEGIGKTKRQNLGNVSGSVTVNSSLGEVVRLTVIGNISNLSVTCPNDNYAHAVTLFITNGGNFTVNWNSNIKFTSNAPALSQNGIDNVRLLTYDNGTTWFASMSGGYVNA